MKWLKYSLLFIVIILILIGGFLFFGYKFVGTKGSAWNVLDNNINEFDKVIVDELTNDPIYKNELDYVYRGDILEEFENIGVITGNVDVYFEDEKYYILAKFEGLPDLPENYRYRGWFSYKGITLDFFSTGLVKKVGDSYINVFVTDKDPYKELFLYDLTIEDLDEEPPGSIVMIGRFEETASSLE
jgi:hypothetical protein